MSKAAKKLKARTLSVQRVEDAHYDSERIVFLNLKCLEGCVILAISPADLSFIAGFSARQIGLNGDRKRASPRAVGLP